MVAVHFPRLVFRYPFDEAAAYEAEARGYLAYAVVDLNNGTRYPVVFYDPVRLQQDLEVEVSEGRPFIAEPGMIVVPEVTIARMQEAVERLFQNGFFDSLKGEPAQGREPRQVSWATEPQRERLPGPFIEDQMVVAPGDLPRMGREVDCLYPHDVTRQPDLFPGE